MSGLTHTNNTSHVPCSTTVKLKAEKGRKFLCTKEWSAEQDRTGCHDTHSQFLHLSHAIHVPAIITGELAMVAVINLLVIYSVELELSGDLGL